MDPFELHMLIHIFLNNHIGGIATYDAFSQYREALNRVAAKIFSLSGTQQLKIKLLRRMSPRMVLIHVHLGKT